MAALPYTTEEFIVLERVQKPATRSVEGLVVPGCEDGLPMIRLLPEVYRRAWGDITDIRRTIRGELEPELQA